MQIDTGSEFGQRVERRLQEEVIIWLTTVRADGQPLSVPVWFLWDGDSEVLMYSQPNAPKMRNIAAHPKVALNFNSDATGGNVIRFEAEAWHDPDFSPVHDNAAYVEKYGARIAGHGVTPEQFAGEYSAPVRMRLTKVRGF